MPPRVAPAPKYQIALLVIGFWLLVTWLSGSLWVSIVLAIMLSTGFFTKEDT